MARIEAVEKARRASGGLERSFVRNGRLLGVLSVSRSFGDVALKARAPPPTPPPAPALRANSTANAAGGCGGAAAAAAAAGAGAGAGVGSATAAGAGDCEALTARPEVTRFLLHPEERDEFLVLASDGVWDALGSQAAVDLLRRALARDECAQRAAELLVREAVNRSGHADNASPVVVVLHQIEI